METPSLTIADFEKMISADAETVTENSVLSSNPKINQILTDSVDYCYEPIEEAMNSQHDHLTKFGGYPYLRNESDWPTCSSCSSKIKLLFQFNKNDEDLFQHFLCHNSDCDAAMSLDDLDSNASVFKWIKIQGPSFIDSSSEGSGEKQKKVSGWKKTRQIVIPEDLSKYELSAEEDIIVEDEKMNYCSWNSPAFFGKARWTQYPFPPYDQAVENGLEYLYRIDDHEHFYVGLVFRNINDNTYHNIWEN